MLNDEAPVPLFRTPLYSGLCVGDLFELKAHFVDVLSGKFNALHAQGSRQAVLGAPDPDAAAEIQTCRRSFAVV